MKILFFGIQYHTYTRCLIDEMERIGAEVTFVDLQPRTIAYKLLRTGAQNIFERMVARRLEEAVELASMTSYDKVVFLQAHQMPTNILRDLRQSQPQAQFSLYNWDAITTHNYRPQAAYFDRVLTFDRQDAEAHGYNYLPLFCIRRWQRLRIERASPLSVYMVGNIVKPQRYSALKQFRDFCNSNGLIFREHLKVSPVVFSQLVKQGMWPQGIKLTSIPETDFAQMIETSQAAFDFANHAQSGQTMRMIESLCSGKKIITNNQWVKLEPFFSPDRIHVFKGTDFSGVPDFLDTPLDEPHKRFSAYHIQSFTRKFIGIDPL